jgi:hypothetical protein
VAEAETTSPIQELFQKAKMEGRLEYLYVLVRIDGIQCYDGYKDELVVLRDWLNHPDATDLPRAYRFLASLAEPVGLLQNLLNLSNGRHYQVLPFIHLKKGSFPKAVWPNAAAKIESLIRDARTSGFPELADQIAASYPPHLLGEVPLEVAEVSAAYSSLSALLKHLMDCYFEKRLRFKGDVKYIRLPNSLDVLELITDDEFGLSGLRVHFPQNCTAEFLRTSKGIFGTNLEFGPPVTFLIMSLEPSTNEYRVNGKRLHEIGLPGRYNKLGEWKPLIYPGRADHLIKEANGLSEDPDVQGVLLYMRLTGHRCIEFVLRTNLELPGSYTSTKERNLHIWKCPVDAQQTANTDVRIYDCWLDLETDGVEDVKRGLAGIAYFVNVLCFPFEAAYSWRNKYRMTIEGPGLLTPTHDDCKIVDSMLQTFSQSPDEATLLVSGIDWYNRGSISTNVFNSFLCYYIALEIVAVAIADGSQLGRTPPAKQNKAEKKALASACIQTKYAELFAADPIRFVRESYFDCVGSLTSRTRAGVASVFGEGHPYLKQLFEESSGGDLPLKDLRGDLAHGDVTLMHKQHEHLVRKHVYEMGHIAKEFLLRVLFRLDPPEKVPSWSGAFKRSLMTADPRSTMVCSTEAIFPKGTEWTIRPEWCE